MRLNTVQSAFNFSQRERTRIYKKVLRYLKPRTLEIVSDEEIREIIDKVSKGVNDADLALAISYSHLFCEKCGECCRQCSPIVLAEEDVAFLGSFLGSALHTYVLRKNNQWQFRQTKPCIFLRNNLCRIYDYRPLVCRTFPFTPVNDSGKVTLAHYSYCRFVLNMVSRKAVSLIFMRALEKENPKLHGKVKAFTESKLSGIDFKDLSQREAISKFLKITEDLKKDLPKI